VVHKELDFPWAEKFALFCRPQKIQPFFVYHKNVPSSEGSNNPPSSVTVTPIANKESAVAGTAIANPTAPLVEVDYKTSHAL
jgi:hypothetical protein